MTTKNRPYIILDNMNILINNFFITGLILTCVVGYDVAHTPNIKAIDVSPAPEPSPEATTTPQAIPNDPEGYVRYIFGDHTDKALLLLKGNEVCSGENKQLDPLAVNRNRDGSRDRGIFQINDKFHPLTDAQAFDFKQNINYAYRMFKNDNYAFVRWTVGRCLNI